MVARQFIAWNLSANCELWRRLITPFSRDGFCQRYDPGNKLPGYYRSVPPGQTSAVGINNRRLLTSTLPDRSLLLGDQRVDLCRTRSIRR